MRATAYLTSTTDTNATVQIKQADVLLGTVIIDFEGKHKISSDFADTPHYAQAEAIRQACYMVDSQFHCEDGDEPYEVIEFDM